jgi:hypothetical protein
MTIRRLRFQLNNGQPLADSVALFDPILTAEQSYGM